MVLQVPSILFGSWLTGFVITSILLFAGTRLITNPRLKAVAEGWLWAIISLFLAVLWPVTLTVILFKTSTLKPTDVVGGP